MNQSKKQSLLEVLTGIGIGALGSWLITMLCLHLIEDRTMAGTVTVAGCTVWSLVRGYCIRRYFNGVMTP